MHEGKLIAHTQLCLSPAPGAC